MIYKTKCRSAHYYCLILFSKHKELKEESGTFRRRLWQVLRIDDDGCRFAYRMSTDKDCRTHFAHAPLEPHALETRCGIRRLSIKLRVLFGPIIGRVIRQVNKFRRLSTQLLNDSGTHLPSKHICCILNLSLAT